MVAICIQSLTLDLQWEIATELVNSKRESVATKLVYNNLCN